MRPSYGRCSMAGSFGQLFLRNWPIKLAALFFAVMLYVAVAAQQPVPQTLMLRLEVLGPPGRPIKQQPGDVAVLISGKGGELLKLRSLPRVITKVLPDTFSGSVWRWRGQPSALPLPQGVGGLLGGHTPPGHEGALDSAPHQNGRAGSRVTLPAPFRLPPHGV